MGLMGLGHLVKYGMDEFLIADFMGDYGTWEAVPIFLDHPCAHCTKHNVRDCLDRH